MSKRVLSLALVVVMLMSMFAFSTSAADLTTGQIGIRVESNAYVGMPAGEEVTFKVYYVVPDDLDLTTYKHGIGNTPVAFTSGFALNTNLGSAINAKDARTWGASYADFFADSNVSTTAAYQTKVKDYAAQDDATKTWTGACVVQMGYNSSNGYSNSTGFTLDPDCEVFSLSFITTATITKDDAIIVPASAYNTTYFKIAYNANLKNNVYAAENVVIEDNVAVPAAKKVYHVKNQIQWADKANNKVNLGIVCGFDIADIGIKFENGTSTNVSSVGVTATINGVTDTYTERFVYSAKEGTAYYFRAVIGNVPGDYNGTITITPFVVVDGETEYGNAIEITADVLASNVAKLPA